MGDLKGWCLGSGMGLGGGGGGGGEIVGNVGDTWV